MIWGLAALSLALAIAGVLLWRQNVNLKENLLKAVNTDNAQVVRDLKAKVDRIPDLIKAAEVKAVEDYIASLTPVPTEVSIDGVTREDIIEVIRMIEEDQRNITTQGDAIDLFFENNRVHGNPYWPNEGPITDEEIL